MNITKAIAKCLCLCVVLGRAESLCTSDDHEQTQSCTALSYFTSHCYNVIVNADYIDPDTVVELFCTDCREEILNYLCDCDETNSSGPQQFDDLCTSNGYPPPTLPLTTNPSFPPALVGIIISTMSLGAAVIMGLFLACIITFCLKLKRNRRHRRCRSRIHACNQPLMLLIDPLSFLVLLVPWPTQLLQMKVL